MRDLSSPPPIPGYEGNTNSTPYDGAQVSSSTSDPVYCGLAADAYCCYGQDLRTMPVPAGSIPVREGVGPFEGQFRCNPPGPGSYLLLIPRANIVKEAGNNVFVSFYIPPIATEGFFDLGYAGFKNGLGYIGSNWKKVPVNQFPGGFKFMRYTLYQGEDKLGHDIDLIEHPNADFPGEEHGAKLAGVM